MAVEGRDPAENLCPIKINGEWGNTTCWLTYIYKECYCLNVSRWAKGPVPERHLWTKHCWKTLLNCNFVLDVIALGFSLQQIFQTYLESRWRCRRSCVNSNNNKDLGAGSRPTEIIKLSPAVKSFRHKSTIIRFTSGKRKVYLGTSKIP